MFALALCACATPGPESGPTALGPFDDTMRTWTATHHVPRSSIAVMRNDRLMFAAGYGGRGASDRLPVWSLSKAAPDVSRLEANGTPSRPRSTNGGGRLT